MFICHEMAAVSIFPPILDICIIVSIPLALCYNPTQLLEVVLTWHSSALFFIKNGEKPDNPLGGT